MPISKPEPELTSPVYISTFSGSPERARYARVLAEAGMFNDWPDDDDSGFVNRVYQVGDYTIRHRGPALSLVDEDSLLAIIQLSRYFQVQNEGEQKRITEIAKNANQQAAKSLLTLPGPKIAESLNFELDGDQLASALMLDVKLVGKMSYRAINSYLGKSDGTANRLSRAASVERLSQTLLSVEHEGVTSSAEPLIKIKTAKSNSADFEVSYTPEIQKLFADYIEINVHLRNQLSDLGKGIHRILTLNGFPNATQAFSSPCQDISLSLGYRSKFTKFRESLDTGRSDGGSHAKGSLHVLKDFRFVGGWEWSGVGKKGSPNVLTIYPPQQALFE